MHSRARGAIADRSLVPLALSITLLASGCDSGPTEPAADARITGRVHTVEGTPRSGLLVTWDDGTREYSDIVTGDGTFSVPAVAGSTGELRIEQQGESHIHPFLYPMAVDEASDLSIILVPKEWTIRKGIYQNMTVPVSLDLVMDDPSSGLSYYNVGRTENHLSIRMNLLSASVLPLKVAIDHTYGPADRPFSAADSTTMWNAWNRMEVVFGENLFEPVRAEPSWVTGEPRRIPGVVLVRKLDGTIANARLFRSPERPDWEQHLGDWAAGGRFTSFVEERGWIDSGEILIGNTPEPPMGWGTVYTHEMLHILGAGHTNTIPSPQGPTFRTSEPSEYDVAYLELAREIMRLERLHDTHLSLMPATIGQRRLELGLPALPTLQER